MFMGLAVLQGLIGIMEVYRFYRASRIYRVQG